MTAKIRKPFLIRSHGPAHHGQYFTALDAGFFLVLVVEREFHPSAVGAGILYLVVEAFPRFLRITEDPLAALVENHGLVLLALRHGFFLLLLEFELAELLAVATGAERSSVELKVAIKA